MIDKSNNHTRYNTEDLNNIIEAIDSISFDADGYTYQFKYAKTLTHVRQTSKWCQKNNQGGYAAKVTKCFSTLTIVSVPCLLHSEYGLEMVGLAGGACPVLPVKITKKIILVIMSRWTRDLKHAGLKITDKFKLERMRQATLLSERMTIRIENNIESGAQSRIKLSQEEKISRLQSLSFYGPGGVLEGPHYYSAGDRSHSSMWRVRIRDAAKFYNRERDHRIKHIPALEKLGVEPVPYETFSQYLRRIADELE